MGKFYITTAIPYVNALPHMGHMLEFVQGDVIARYNRLKGDDVLLLTGADENSLTNVKAADEQKIKPQELVDKNSVKFIEYGKRMEISFDVFARSSASHSKEHWPGVQELWKLADKSGDIYEKEYSGLYCIRCELFYTEEELDHGLCPIHKIKLELVSERNYFFRLSKYQERIKRLIESGELRIVPETRKNEVLGVINEGLKDFSVSRSITRARGWGVPVPGSKDQIIYVWFDALSIYITGIGYGTDPAKFKKWWPADVHVIGKDIIRFHALYWPAMLMSAGLELPRTIFVHGFVNLAKQKMSKTRGNVVDPVKLLEKYTPDELKYYLISDIPTFDDGEFSEEALADRINKELLGDLGNLVNRVLTLVEKTGKNSFSGKKELQEKLKLDLITQHLDALELQKALNEVMAFVRECNKYINDKKPWTLKGEDLDSVLYNLLESIRIIAILASPFLPVTSQRINEQLGTRPGVLKDCKFRDDFKGRIKKGEHLFKKIE